MAGSILTSGNLIVFMPAVALVIDLMFGDPPNRWHPVAWMGSAIYAYKRLAPKRGHFLPLLCSIALSLSGMAAIGIIAFLAVRTLRPLPVPVRVIVESGLLKLCISMRGLTQAAKEIHSAMAKDDLEEGRRLVSWHLVSRDTSSLGKGHIASATIESVAENLSDGIVAPIFWWALAGLPGAWIYRFVNTADSILGYHTPELEWVGKVPARMDDAMNFIPARISAFLLLIAALLLKLNPFPGTRKSFSDHKLTSSPNAGWPMSTMAGILGIRLEKIGHYNLNHDARFPENRDILRSASLMQIAAWLSATMGIARLILPSLTAMVSRVWTVLN